ncbi:MAG: acyl-CoA reductase [Gemmatimonadota bacterium]|nr:acyl-CoA reductase [Gemmatimonadota bacterium]
MPEPPAAGRAGPASAKRPDPPSGRCWHLPGLDSEAVAGEYEATTETGGRVRAPRLTTAQAIHVASEVRAAALEARRERRLAEVLDAASRAAGRLADPGDPAGREAADVLGRELGWSAAASGRTLRDMAEVWRRDALADLLERELGDPAVLDAFRPDPDRPGRRRRALGAPLQFLVLSGNVPGVGVTALLRGLLARSGLLARVSAREPGLPALFARLLAQEDPLLGRTVAVTWWPADEAAPAWEAWSARAGTVVVYGGAEAVAGVRARVGAAADLLVYGPRTGIAVLLPDAPPGTAAALARDVCAYEQRGCVSPRLVFVVGGDALDAGAAVAEALAAEAARRPPPPLSSDEAVRIRAVRAEAEFAGLAQGASPGRVFGPEDLSWTVLAGGEPGIASTALPRTVWVHAVPDVAALLALLAPLERRIQAIGTAGDRGLAELAEGAAALGTSRVAPLGRLAWPPADWRHEGKHQILPLLSWTDWEDAAG